MIRNKHPQAGSINFFAATGECLTVFLLFALITIFFFGPALPHLTQSLIGPPEDNLNDFWNSWYAAVAADHAHFFETNLVRYPDGTPLFFHDFAYPVLFVLVLLAQALGTTHGSLVFLQNLMILISFPLSGTAAFYLVRHFTHHTAASIVGGFVFAFNPSHFAHALHHLGIAQIEFFPLFALAWILTIKRKSVGWLVVAIICYALGSLCCWYYLFYMGFFVLFHTIYLRIRDNELPRGWKLAAPILCFAGVGLLLSPLILPMILQTQSPHVYYADGNFFVADLAGFFTFFPTHMLGGLTAGLFSRFSGNPWEATVYLGLINVGLIFWLIWYNYRKKVRIQNYFLAGIIVFCTLACGNTLHILGYDLYFPMPNILLSSLPFVAEVRTPSRIIVLVYLFLSIGVGYALATIAREHKGKLASVCLTGLAALIVLDFYPSHVQMTDARCPAGLDIIASDKEHDFGVLNLPLTYLEGNIAMFQQTCHGRPVAHASLSRLVRPSLIDGLEQKNLALQHQQLVRARVKYIIFDSAASSPIYERNKVRYEKQYRPIFRSSKLTIARVY